MRRFLIAFCLAGLAPVGAQASDFGGLVLVKGVVQEGRDAGLALPGVDFDARTIETAAVFEGSNGGLRYRLRAEAFGSAEAGWPAKSDVRLKELSYGRRINEAWSYSVGVQQRSWDSSLAYAPLGFFRARTDLSDPFDSEARQEGLPMIVVTRLGHKVNMEAIVSERLSRGTQADRLNGRQAALRISGDPLPGVNAALVVRQRAGARAGVGASATYQVGAVEIHADAFYGPAQAGYAYRGFTDLAPQFYVSDPFPLVKAGPSTLRSGVGMTWTPTDSLTIRTEWSHRDDGLSANDWARYRTAIAVHRAALAGPGFGKGFQNLAYDLTALRSVAQRDQVFVMASFEHAKITYSASRLTGMDDQSSVTNLSVGGLLAYKVNFNVGVSAFSGELGTQFGLLPIKGSAFATLGRPF